ncbi:M35 family metallo-endopeptidase [Azospirillum palustre]
MIRLVLSTKIFGAAFLGAALCATAATSAHAADWIIQNSCTQGQKAAIQNARRTAFSWVSKTIGSFDYVKNRKPPAYTTFTTWMGQFADPVPSLVKGAYSGINGYLDNGKVQADCQTAAPPVPPPNTCYSNPTWIAYTQVGVGATPLVVVLCNNFFTDSDNGKVNTLIHELAHRANKLIIDQVMPPGAPNAGQGAYGAANVQWLAANRPEMASKNAENYNFLAENMYNTRY